MRPFRELIKTMDMQAYVFRIIELLGDDHVHHAQRERSIGARINGQVPVGALRCAGLVWIDHHELGAFAPGLFYKRP